MSETPDNDKESAGAAEDMVVGDGAATAPEADTEQAEAAKVEATTESDEAGTDEAEVEKVVAPARLERAGARAARSPSRNAAVSPKTKQRREVTVSLGGLVWTVLLVVFVVSTGVLAYLYVDAKDTVDKNKTHTADVAHAEQVAGDFAKQAASVDYKDLTPWLSGMKKSVTPDLRKKYDVIGPSLEQIIVPLQLQVTADVVTSKVKSSANGMFQVVTVVELNSKNIQQPQGGTTYATYETTLDKKQKWVITKVGDPTSSVTDAIPGLDGKQSSVTGPSPSPSSGAAQPSATTPAQSSGG